jgi:hypothetical protein
MQRTWSRFAKLSLSETIDLFVRERGRVAIDDLTLDVAYGFRDIALTGQITGALYALSGVLPAQIVLTQRPSWAGDERWELTGAGHVRLWPGLVLLEVLWYMLRKRASA